MFWRRRNQSDFDAEINAHLEFEAERYQEQGLSKKEARMAARRSFGNVTQTRERFYESTQWLHRDLLQDLRYGFHALLDAPGFSIAVILTLALGIGANSAIFSVVNAVLLKPPPYPSGERLIQAWETTAGQKIPVSWINFQHWCEENHSFENMAGFENADLALTDHGSALLTHAGVVSASFFRLTGWQPVIGRSFADKDDRVGAAPVVLITSEFWARVLSRDPQVVGSLLNLDGRGYRVIGVLPPGERFFLRPVDFYLPIRPREGAATDRGDHGSMTVLALLKSGVRQADARADLDVIMRRLSLTDPGAESQHRASIAWLAGFGTEEIRPALLMLMAAVGFVLIIACANVAGLLLVRSTKRAREFAIRSAMGAGRGRLARQLITENLVIATLGGIVGLALAEACLRLLLIAGPSDIPRLWEARLDWRVLLFTAATTILTGLLAGLAPLFSLRAVDLTAALKEGSAAAGGSRKGNRLRSGLVISEIAITLALSFACGLLLQSLYLAQTSNPGFSAAHVLALELQLPSSRYKSDDAIRRFYGQLMGDLRRQHGVESVGAVNCPPSTGGCAKGWYSIAGMPAPPRDQVPLTLLTTVDAHYFGTMAIPLIAGRSFTDTDTKGRPNILMVNDKLARHWWPKEPQLAVGQLLKLGGPYMDGPTFQIAGVVADVKQGSLDEEPFAEIYVPFAQNLSPAMVVMVRLAGSPANFMPTVRRTLASVDRDVPIQSLRPFEQWMEATLERRRFSTLLLAIFAGLAVTLSAVGIYGILNFWVRVRQREIAIRQAIGAQRPDILRWAGSSAMRMVALGLALGVFGASVVARGLSSILYGISPASPAIMLVAVSAVTGVAILAASVPMWRATRVDSVRNLRDS